jgi:hypothetical protein
MLFVDLPNFYRRIARLDDIAPHDQLRDYFVNWFDFSVLSHYLTAEPKDVWIFYSSGRLVADKNRIDGPHLKELVERFDRQRGVCVQDVNIPGDQREPYSIACPSCSAAVDAEFKSEKGIDSSLTVHMFDTVGSWDVAYLLSGDADFVPAVRSLRRQGKTVIGAGIVNGASKALIRECFEYKDLGDFLKADFAAYQLFKDGGLLYDQLRSFLPAGGKPGRAVVAFELKYQQGTKSATYSFGSSEVDWTSFREQVIDLGVDQNLTRDWHTFTFPAALFETILHKLQRYLRKHGTWNGNYTEEGGHQIANYSVAFHWNEASSEYVHQ